MALVLLAVSLQLAGTTHGMVVSPDSVAYLATAKEIARGHGAMAPYGVNPPPQPIPSLSAPAVPRLEATTIFEPLYSALLAPFVLAFGLHTAARLAATICFVILMLLVAWVPYVWSKHSSAFWLGPLLVLVAPDLLGVYVNVESETLFLPLVVLSALLLWRYLTRPAVSWLLLAALTVAAAVLTRYAGLGLIPGGALAIVWRSDRPWRRVAADAAIFSAVSIGPVAAWLVRNTLRGGGTNRVIRFHSLSRADLHSALHALGSWFAPSDAPGIAKVAAAVLVAALLVAMLRHSDARTARYGRMLLILAVAYLAGVIFSDSFLDVSTGLDARILAPLHVLLLLGVAALIATFLAERTTTVRLLPVVLIAILGLVGVARGVIWLHDARHSSVGYADPSWQDSAFLAAVERIPPDTPIFSNGGDVVWYVDRRGTYSLPQVYNPQSGLPDRQLRPQLAKLARFIKLRRADVALMTKITWRPYLPSESTLRAYLPVTTVAVLPDGVILGPAR